MIISDRLKSAQEMKNLQAEVRVVKEEKKPWLVQLEPLQEQDEKMIAKLDTEKGRLEQMHSESLEVLKEHVIMQVVETLTEKGV